MKKELQDILFDRYPGLFVEASLSSMESCMGRGITCGDGWFNIIDKLCETLINHKTKDNEAIVFKQIKEKFGYLRVYLAPYNEELNEIVAVFESRSIRFCELCGSENSVAPLRDSTWKRYVCQDCQNDYNTTEGRPWDDPDFQAKLDKRLAENIVSTTILLEKEDNDAG